jgi:hypothetical protein
MANDDGFKSASQPDDPSFLTRPSAGARVLHARCFCGTVHFTVEDALASAFYCHCSRCRRRTGAACAAIGRIASDKVRLTRGDQHVRRLGESGEDYVAICRQCCSPLYSLVNGGRFTHVPLGVLEEAPSKTPDHHIQVASKATWHTIDDDLPQYAAFPP